MENAQAIKILYLVTIADIGGAQRYILDLVENLPQEKFSVSVAAGGTGPLFDRLGKKQVATYALKHLRRQISPYHDMAAIFEVAALLKRLKPDVVHLNSSKAGIIGSIAARLTGVSYAVYTAHGFVFNEPMAAWQRAIYRGLERWTAHYKSAIICVSEADRQSALRYRIAPPEKLVTIHNGINPEKIHFLSRTQAREMLTKTYHLSPITYHLVGTIANLYPAKGLDDLITAARVVIKKFPDAHFVVMGEGPERLRLEKIIHQNHLGSYVHLIGALPNAARLLPAFDLYVNASHKEGLPYSILEALAAGRPVIATAVGGVPEIIRDHQEGRLVPPHNPPLLAAAIQSLLSDPQQSATLGPAGTRRIQNHFTQTRMLEQTAACYRQLVKKEWRT